MEVYYLNHPHHVKREEITATCYGIRFFDGVHLGHQKVILNQQKKSQKKMGLKSAVMSFDPHPSVVLGRSVQHVEYITPLEEKIRVNFRI